MFRLDHIMIRTENIPNSIAFYAHVFGMNVLAIDNREAGEYESSFIGTEDGNFQIDLVKSKAHDNQEGNIVDHIAFRVDENPDHFGDRARSIGYQASNSREHLANNHVYLISTIKSPEGVDFAIIQKKIKG